MRKIGGALPTNKCSFVAQMGPNTINSGFLLFEVSFEGERILSSWVSSHKYHAMQSVKWQDDQGWLQFVYLQYLQRYLNITFPFDCTEIRRRDAENTLRNLCFAKNLRLMRLLPPMRDTGRLCLLLGLTAIDRVNIHDWPGRVAVDDSSGQLTYTPSLPNTSSKIAKISTAPLIPQR